MSVNLRRARRAAFFWGLLLFGLTSWPAPPSVPILSGIPNFDKAVHATLYGVEAVLLYYSVAWPGRKGFTLLRALAIVGVMAVWGTMDEIHQFWIPGRSMEGADALADTGGALVGTLAISVLARGRSSRLSNR